MTVNGKALRMDLPPQNGYLAITRTWKAGDTVELTLAMGVQTVWAHPAVRQMQGRLAIQRGPLVYCLEGADNSVENLDRIALDPAAVANFSAVYKPDLLGGVTVLLGEATVVSDEGWDEQLLYRYGEPSTTATVAVTAIPYPVWDNRAAGEMRVWFRRQTV